MRWFLLMELHLLMRQLAEKFLHLPLLSFHFLESFRLFFLRRARLARVILEILIVQALQFFHICLRLHFLSIRVPDHQAVQHPDQ